MQFFIEVRIFVDGLLVIGEDLFKDSYKIMCRDYSPQTLFFILNSLQSCMSLKSIFDQAESPV